MGCGVTKVVCMEAKQYCCQSDGQKVVTDGGSGRGQLVTDLDVQMVRSALVD